MTTLRIISFVALVVAVSGTSNCGCPSVVGTKRCFVVPKTDVVETNCCSTEDIINCKEYARNRFETVDLDDYHLYTAGSVYCTDAMLQSCEEAYPGKTKQVKGRCLQRTCLDKEPQIEEKCCLGANVYP